MKISNWKDGNGLGLTIVTEPPKTAEEWYNYMNHTHIIKMPPSWQEYYMNHTHIIKMPPSRQEYPPFELPAHMRGQVGDQNETDNQPESDPEGDNKMHTCTTPNKADRSAIHKCKCGQNWQYTGSFWRAVSRLVVAAIEVEQLAETIGPRYADNEEAKITPPPYGWVGLDVTLGAMVDTGDGHEEVTSCRYYGHETENKSYLVVATRNKLGLNSVYTTWGKGPVAYPSRKNEIRLTHLPSKVKRNLAHFEVSSALNSNHQKRMSHGYRLISALA